MTTSIVGPGLDQLVALLGSVSPDNGSLTTPCAEWTVDDLSDHIVNGVAGMATMARGGAPDWSASTHHDDPEVATSGHAFMTASMTDAMRGGAFGPEQPAPPDADPYERVAAFAGRSVGS